MDYAQPDFYHFNEDSIKLAKYVAKNSGPVHSLLDAGAGCGVIGIEIAQLIEVDELHFLEVQEKFIPYIQENLKLFLPEQTSSIINASFSAYKSSQLFDVIVSNPPYYLPDRGQPNKDQNKGICRSFQIDSWGHLLALFHTHLKPSGKAWVVVKNDKSLLSLIQKELRSKPLRLEMRDMNDIVFLCFTLQTEYKY